MHRIYPELEYKTTQRILDIYSISVCSNNLFCSLYCQRDHWIISKTMYWAFTMCQVLGTQQQRTQRATCDGAEACSPHLVGKQRQKDESRVEINNYLASSRITWTQQYKTLYKPPPLPQTGNKIIITEHMLWQNQKTEEEKESTWEGALQACGTLHGARNWIQAFCRLGKHSTNLAARPAPRRDFCKGNIRLCCEGGEANHAECGEI